MNWAWRLAPCEKTEGRWDGKSPVGKEPSSMEGLEGLIVSVGTQRTGQAATESLKSYIRGAKDINLP